MIDPNEIERVRFFHFELDQFARHMAMPGANTTAGYFIDKYEQHRNNLVDRLRRDGRWQPGKARDVLTAASMELENNARDEWKQAQTGVRQLSPRERLVAGIRSEFDTSSAERRRLVGKRFDGTAWQEWDARNERLEP